MADENTTDLTPTPTDQPATDQSQATGSESSSTTETPQADPPAEDEGTLLTGKEPKADEPEKTPEQLAAEAEHAKLFGAPEGDYEIAGLPDDMEIDKAALDAVTPVAKELGLSNEGFSKLANVYATQVLPQVTETVVDNLQKDIAAQHATWASEAIELVKTDPIFEGKPLTEVQQFAAKSIDRFGGEDFRKFLNDTGLGNHPAMMKFAYATGMAIAEDTSFERGSTAPTKKTVVEKFYGPQS